MVPTRVSPIYIRGGVKTRASAASAPAAVQFAAALSHYLKMGMGIFPTATNPDRKIREGNQSSIWPGCGEFAPATVGNGDEAEKNAATKTQG
jgi:hypothetical protein